MAALFCLAASPAHAHATSGLFLYFVVFPCVLFIVALVSSLMTTVLFGNMRTTDNNSRKWGIAKVLVFLALTTVVRIIGWFIATGSYKTALATGLAFAPIALIDLASVWLVYLMLRRKRFAEATLLAAPVIFEMALVWFEVV